MDGVAVISAGLAADPTACKTGPHAALLFSIRDHGDTVTIWPSRSLLGATRRIITAPTKLRPVRKTHFGFSPKS